MRIEVITATSIIALTCLIQALCDMLIIWCACECAVFYEKGGHKDGKVYTTYGYVRWNQAVCLLL
ncbi:hypothetical protein KSX_21090 [Ktedonospora formicarum]|uniref:Uncharacterized protein n=1 Tax=Ktedonospora formicarum TaxID=2778364 RepID=A0A8J3MRM7_9CHLR|nr:hypothetical protein KSX_21090 [Ktedonospora formicarum]